MQHDLSRKLYHYWLDNRQGDNLPSLDLFPSEILEGYDGCALVFKLRQGEIILDYTGARNAQVLSSDLSGKPITELFPPALKSLQMSLIMPCIQQKIGMVRMSRVWFGHRHKDVEWIMLPVQETATGGTALIGLSLTFVDFDDRDYVTVGSTMVERIMRQNFLSLGQTVDLSVLDSHSWAVLDTMGAVVALDGENISHTTMGLVGDAGLVATKVAHANVLAVARPSDFGRILRRLGARYNLKMVETLEEARLILQKDMVDVLVVSEALEDISGLELIREAQATSAFTACVMMLDPRNEAEDTRVIEDGKFVQCLVKPVGEFALRKALDDANQHVQEHRRADLSEPKV